MELQYALVVAAHPPVLLHSEDGLEEVVAGWRLVAHVEVDLVDGGDLKFGVDALL